MAYGYPLSREKSFLEALHCHNTDFQTNRNHPGIEKPTPRSPQAPKAFQVHKNWLSSKKWIASICMPLQVQQNAPHGQEHHRGLLKIQNSRCLHLRGSHVLCCAVWSPNLRLHQITESRPCSSTWNCTHWILQMQSTIMKCLEGIWTADQWKGEHSLR